MSWPILLVMVNELVAKWKERNVLLKQTVAKSKVLKTKSKELEAMPEELEVISEELVAMSVELRAKSRELVLKLDAARTTHEQRLAARVTQHKRVSG